MSFLAKLDKLLAGWPDMALTWTLTALGLFGILVAWLAPAPFKAFLAAYFLLP